MNDAGLLEACPRADHQVPELTDLLLAHDGERRGALLPHVQRLAPLSPRPEAPSFRPCRV